MSTAMFSLYGKKALVTGASRGIGRVIAEGLAVAGADVAVSSRSIEALKDCAKAIREMGQQASSICMDVSDVGSCRRGVAEAAESLGGLDILVNNAGVEQVCASLDVEEELWDRIVGTNLKGAFFAAQAAARLMNSGAILNICSLTSERGIPTAVPYGSSKTGLRRHDAGTGCGMGSAGHQGQCAGTWIFPHVSHRIFLQKRLMATSDAGSHPHAALW